MVDGGRDLEAEIRAAFFDKIAHDDEIPEEIVQRLQALEESDGLTDSASIQAVIKEVLEHED